MTYRPQNATLDTVQTVTGAKTFDTGKLLMTSPVASNVEPYSDANPPATLDMTDILQGSVTNPAAGLARLYTPDGLSLRLRDNGGTDSLIGPSAGGGGGTSGVEFDLTQDWTTTSPSTPTTGSTIFTRHKARRTLAVVGPNGLDTSLQPALFSNRIAMMTASPGSAIESVYGMTAARTTAPAAQALAATSFFTRLARLRYSTTATAGAGNGVRTGSSATVGVAGYFVSNQANAGGFFYVARFGVATSQAGSRGFMGLSSTLTQYPAAADPSAGVNQIGFGWNAAHTNLWLMCNGATANTGNHVNLGASFPTKTSATDFYEVRLFAPSGLLGVATTHYAVTRLNTGDFVQGTIGTGLPAADVFMGAHVGLSNGSTAAIAALDIQSLYIETDN